MTVSPQAVLFDFDGIVLDTEWPIYESYQMLYREHGHDLPLTTYVQCIGSDFQQWSPETHLETLTQASFDWPTINRNRQIWIREQLESYQAFPGIREAVEHCRELGLKTAVVSSSSHNWVDGWLEKLSLRTLFDSTICRGDAPRIKPAPDLFLEAARQFETAPDDCLVIEDSANGLAAASTAGMPTYIIPNRITEVSDFPEAIAVLDSAHELPPRISPVSSTG